MSLELLTITGYKDSGFRTLIGGTPYQFMINPESLHWNRMLNAPVAPVSLVDMNFDVIIDCTGIVDSSRINLLEEIHNLEQQLYSDVGGTYHPNYIKITWGDHLSFFTKVKSCDISYTLFNSAGTPIRAKVSLSFGKDIPEPKPVSITPKKKGLLDFLTGR